MNHNTRSPSIYYDSPNCPFDPKLYGRCQGGTPFVCGMAPSSAQCETGTKAVYDPK
jgi:hypothetical protein